MLVQLVLAACALALASRTREPLGFVWAAPCTKRARGWLLPWAPPPPRGRASLAAAAAGPDAARPDEPAPGTLASLEQAEQEDDLDAAYLATDEEVAEQIVADSIGGESEKLERRLRREGKEKKRRVETAPVVPSSDVYDMESLVDKYGGTKRVAANHQVAVDNQMWAPTAFKALKELLDIVQDHKDDGANTFVEIEREGGSRLVVVGTLHVSHVSRDLARSVVRKEQPDCLILECKIGDDSLQEITVPQDLYQDLAMPKSPVQLRDSDDEMELAWKFQEDKAWLLGTPGWKDIGGEAAWGKEFYAAFMEFAELSEQRVSKGLPGGAVCFADFDLRLINPEDEQNSDIFMVPNVEELAWAPNVPLRDLRLARSCRAALMTHKSAVAVVGAAHLPGIVKLLTQDPTIKVVKKGIPIEKPSWQAWVEDGGTEFEKKAMSGVSKFYQRLTAMDAIDAAPIGTWMASGMVTEMLGMHRKTEALMRATAADKLEEVEPVAPTSSEIGETMLSRGLMVTPGGIRDLQRWLNGERIESELSNAKVYPFENSRLAPSRGNKLPGANFPRAPRKPPKFYRTEMA